MLIFNLIVGAAASQYEMGTVVPGLIVGLVVGLAFEVYERA